MQNQTSATSAVTVIKQEVFTSQLAHQSDAVYSELELNYSKDILQEFQQNLMALEDAVGRLQVTLRDVRFHMKVE